MQVESMKHSKDLLSRSQISVASTYGFYLYILSLIPYTSRYVDLRTRQDRTENQTDQWDLQLDQLVDAYLDYRSRDSGDGMPTFKDPEPPLCDSPSTLIYHGYIGCSPIYPTVAISLRTLAAYRQIHRTCPRFSVQAQVKSLCFLHDSPYRPYLCVQFSAAYDIYLEIIHRVNQRLRKALKHDTPHWRMLLQFDWLVSIDGNNSLKRWDSAIYGSTRRTDSRKARSDYWLDTCDVDRFKDEVRTRQSDYAMQRDSDDDNWTDETTANEGAGTFTCVNRWRNAGPDTRKKMFSVFDESGIFIAACRHRFVVLACDMVRSGELAKYPLAIIEKLLAVYGKNGGCAYDIGCAFSKTLTNSSLGTQARELDFRLMVGAFHGHAHNRKCQLDWHPMYIPGIGHTEGEGCEHVFSSSNELARSTRHATPFHRRQTIEEHFSFWDADKYAALSTFLWNHYREGLKSIQTLTAELTAIKAELFLTDEDFPRFLDEERNYLDRLKLPPIWDQLCIRYVEVLDELAERRALAQARIRVDSSYIKLQNAEGLVAHIEAQLAVDQRWEIGGLEYQRFKEEASMGKYRTALDELERLVVMRLFELSKLSLSGTGYKLRQQIGKALQRRSEAIRNAIIRYNTQAAGLNPPRPNISWKDIADYGFLGEFDLLRHSRDDIRSSDWSKPGHREATTKYFKLHRAREEITRLNVEVRRLRTAIHDEELGVSDVMQELLVSDPHLACELQRQYRSRLAINAVHCYRLSRIEKLAGFSGAKGVGVRLQRAGQPLGNIASFQVNSESLENTDLDAIDQEEQDALTEEMADYLQLIVD
ncbi:hypothetical protein DEU56DRAFT_868810 [Suillus clintonianus]|uniref:uncharacterized protein n=1 Tax=Suillus clintonianus TaxID=1904413 RepID=UPI001B868324|nr:uncharacterized protein DEU56DRAFT_868810 [Suillus clintonianus]KAG2152785.1 hypothetical protein DEU56DRAFT_868810 [Suillus clintonianus]